MRRQPERIATTEEARIIDSLVEALPAASVVRSMQRMAIYAHLPPIRNCIPPPPRKPFRSLVPQPPGGAPVPAPPRSATHQPPPGAARGTTATTPRAPVAPRDIERSLRARRAAAVGLGGA